MSRSKNTNTVQAPRGTVADAHLLPHPPITNMTDENSPPFRDSPQNRGAQPRRDLSWQTHHCPPCVPVAATRATTTTSQRQGGKCSIGEGRRGPSVIGKRVYGVGDSNAKNFTYGENGVSLDQEGTSRNHTFAHGKNTRLGSRHANIQPDVVGVNRRRSALCGFVLNCGQERAAPRAASFDMAMK